MHPLTIPLPTSKLTPHDAAVKNAGLYFSCERITDRINIHKVTISFLTTKLQIPALRPGLVLRPRLFQQLNAGLDGKLTLVSASTGFGKTTIVSAWARKCERPVAWFTLDELDNDPLRFLTYLIRAVQEIKKGHGVALLETLNATSPHDFFPAQGGFLEALVAEIAGIQTPFLLVLDDYHVITNPVTQSIPQFLLSHQPENLHLVLVSRADPPWPLGRLRARCEMNELRSADLRFAPHETAEFLNDRMGLGLTGREIATLEARIEGWIAGLQLAALSLQGQDNPQRVIESLAGSHHFIFDYLVEEVLEKQPPELQEFLLKTSILDQMNAALCNELTGRSDSQAVLLQLEQSNLFLQALDHERNWYRYHHLFAELLRIKLSQTHPGLSADLLRRASRWHEAQGQMLEALHYALEAGDAQMAERLFAGNIFVLFEHEDVGAALQKLDAMPLHTFSDQPWLGIARAYLLANSQLQKSHQILDAVAKNLESIPPSAERQRLQGHLSAAWAYMYNLQGDIANTVRHARQAEALLPPAEVDIRAMSLALWGDILSRDGYDPSAMPILEQALQLALQAEKPHAVVIAAAALTLGHLGAGRLREAHRVCQQALAIADEYQQRTHRELSISAMNQALMARICVEWNEIEKAIYFGYQGLAMSERLGQSDTEVMCLEYLGHTLMLSGNPAQARQIFQRAQQSAQKISPWAEQTVMMLFVDALLDSDTPDEAEVLEKLCVLDETNADILKARLLIKTNQPDAALDVLAKTLAGLNEQVAVLVVRPHILRALALQAKGDEHAALAALAQALTLAEPENRVMAFLREGPPMEKLLRLAERKAICLHFTRKLLAAFARRTKPKALIEPLSERELEVLRLLATYLNVPKVAEKLVISTNTVRTHIKSLYRKLNAHSRYEAIARAKALNLL